MKLTSFLTLPFLLTALASAFALAADGGPRTGGNLSTNPNGRVPRTESAVDGGPKTGDTSSVNPIGIDALTTAPPATAEPVATIPAATTPTNTAAPDGGPPKSGGDASTNPFSRRTTAPPPALTTAAPLATKPASTSPATSSPSDDQALSTKTPAPSQSVSGESIDFSLINDDTESGANDVIGEVSPDNNLDASSASASASSSNSTSPSNTAADGETANEADLPQSTETSGPLAATPSPVSTRNASNSKGVTGAARGTQLSVAGVVATVTVTAILSAVGL